MIPGYRRYESGVLVESIPYTQEELAEIATQKEQQAIENRRVAYQLESDPLFFKYQRGAVTEQEWLDKITEIKQRYQKGE